MSESEKTESKDKVSEGRRREEEGEKGRRKRERGDVGIGTVSNELIIT